MKKVLILEDNIETLLYLKKLLLTINSDIEVLTFSNMEGVYEVVLNSYIDLFIVDIIINPDSPGDTSGIRFAEKVRMITKYEFTPIIFITSLEDPKLYAFKTLHSFEYIEKPFDEEYVKSVIIQALRFPVTKSIDHILHFRRDGILFSIKCSEIIYIESVRHKQYFHLCSGAVEVIPYKTCSQILKEADCSDLLQCGRDLIINRRYIENVDLVNMYIKMKSLAKPLEIGITYRRQMAKEFKDGGEIIYNS